MKILTPGHKYELANFSCSNLTGQVIQFIEKRQKPNAPDGTLETVNDGTTNEEVLEMLIDRMKSLAAKFPSKETACAITKCEEALHWLEARTKERLKRGVEGLAKA